MTRTDADYKKACDESAAHVYVSEEKTHLQHSIVDYGKSLSDRATGSKKSLGTTQSHTCAINFFLDSLSKGAIDGLERIGEANGLIDQQLQAKKIQPESMKAYLHSLANYLSYLSGSSKWMRHIQYTPIQLLTLVNKLKNMAKSLKEDINKRLVERQAAGELDIAIEGWMVGSYLSGDRHSFLHNILEEAGTRALTQPEQLEVRNCLMTLLILTNAKRAGDITHLTRDQVVKAKSAKGEDVELLVYEHKEAKSGKKCPIRVTAEVLAFLQKFGKHVMNNTTYMFVTKTGTQISSSSMSKMVNAEWQKFGKSIGKDLPKLTASLNRKLAVTTMREAGANRQEQTALAKHMAHNPETADRFYDKSRRTSDRHAALDFVQGQYKQAFQEKETNV
ncbi:uncharacterized protein LOC134716416 [Mytilus trossulus]|uniref:uncharacterized protein LOC134716416 n=1 Tax=Mytilus trossulus TaxID=6551 RepID=UPI00300536CC